MEPQLELRTPRYIDRIEGKTQVGSLTFSFSMFPSHGLQSSTAHCLLSHRSHSVDKAHEGKKQLTLLFLNQIWSQLKIIVPRNAT